MAELGKIEKPSAESVAGKRKLYCVPSVYHVPDAPEDYNALVDKYWEEVGRQVDKLEHAGKVKKIFCEHLSTGGEEALTALEKINDKALQLVKRKMEEGAVISPVEREELLGPFIDWSNCLAVVRTEEVASKLFEFYKESFDRRLKYVLNAIQDNLAEEEAGLLIIADENRVKLQFPPDIEVFLVTPPSYDDIIRWMRGRLKDLNE